MRDWGNWEADIAYIARNSSRITLDIYEKIPTGLIKKPIASFVDFVRKFSYNVVEKIILLGPYGQLRRAY